MLCFIRGEEKNLNITESSRTNRNENDSNQTKLIMVYIGWKKNLETN